MHLRKVLAGFSIAITLLAFSFYFFDKTAGSAIPRSNVLKGGKQSAGGDVNILLLGLDSRRDNNGNDLPRKLLDLMHVGSSSSIGGYNTNTMIVIHIPANGKNAVSISIPRDDYVSVAGWGMQKIKEAYGLAKYTSENSLLKKGVPNPLREKQSRDAGRAATIATITALLGIPIDHFAEVNLVGFYDIATALGGIQVCLNRAVNDSQYSGGVFPAGLQTISGVQALEFVRQRHGLPNGDLDRTHRQQAFITGVITKFRSQGIFGDLGKLQSLLTVAKKDVVIDSGWDVLGFLPQAKALTGGHITFHTLPIEGYALRNQQSVNLISIPTVRKFVHDLFYPIPKTTMSPTPGVSASSNPKPTPKPKATKFNFAHLANGTAVKGSGIPCVN
jgi:LCP family protein required for cell wall assembly